MIILHVLIHFHGKSQIKQTHGIKINIIIISKLVNEMCKMVTRMCSYEQCNSDAGQIHNVNRYLFGFAKPNVDIDYCNNIKGMWKTIRG